MDASLTRSTRGMGAGNNQERDGLQGTMVKINDAHHQRALFEPVLYGLTHGVRQLGVLEEATGENGTQEVRRI